MTLHDWYLQQRHPAQVVQLQTLWDVVWQDYVHSVVQTKAERVMPRVHSASMLTHKYYKRIPCFLQQQASE